MKKILFFSLLITISTLSTSQTLMEIYQNGPVKLIADETYAQDNDWNNIFTFTPKSFVILPDESVIVNYSGKNTYPIFDKNGKYVKEIGITNSSGKRFKNTRPFVGVINNSLFTEVDNIGNMYFTDFEGNYLKTMKFNYMVNSIIPMTDEYFAIAGSVLYKGTFKELVAIINYNTNEEKIIWENLRENYGINKVEVDVSQISKKIENEYNTEIIAYITSNAGKKTGYNDSSPKITFIDGKLIVAVPAEGEILIFNSAGKLLSKEKIEYEEKYVSAEERRESFQKTMDEHVELKLSFHKDITEEQAQAIRDIFIKDMKESANKILEPYKLPAFATIIKDSDDNLLFFEIPEEEGANKFDVWIYENGGKFICQSSFVCDDYNLAIMPSKMVFHNGYIYALQNPKGSDKNKLQLVRFKVSN